VGPASTQAVSALFQFSISISVLRSNLIDSSFFIVEILTYKWHCIVSIFNDQTLKWRFLIFLDLGTRLHYSIFCFWSCDIKVQSHCAKFFKSAVRDTGARFHLFLLLLSTLAVPYPQPNLNQTITAT